VELGAAVFDLQELQDLFQPGLDGHVRLLDVRVALADERTARKLRQEPNAPVIYIRRLFLQGGLPVFYHRAFLVYDPTRPTVEAEMDVTSLQGLFSGGDNTLLKHGELKIEATLLNEEEAGLLKKPLPAAGFMLEHVFYDFENCPISWGWFIIPQDRLQFRTRVGITE
jgi:GntR family transcriptional regulator